MKNAALTPYSPLDDTDWDVKPGVVARALDELAQRVTDAHPGSSTDNAIARYDGTAGKLQGSGVEISDLDAMVGLASVSIDTGGWVGADVRNRITFITNVNQKTHVDNTLVRTRTNTSTNYHSTAVTNFPHIFALQFGDSTARTGTINVQGLSLLKTTSTLAYRIPWDFEIIAISCMVNITTATSGDVSFAIHFNGTQQTATNLVFTAAAGTGKKELSATGLSVSGTGGTDRIGAAMYESGTMAWDDLHAIVWVRAYI